MIAFFKNLFPKRKSEAVPVVDRLTYAIGDIHGRADLFSKMIDMIREDSYAYQEKPRVVLLGDYIDRGPASDKVLEMILKLKDEIWCDLEVLMGNHEMSLVNFLEDPESGATWVQHGGGTTLMNYGVQAPPMRSEAEAWIEARDQFGANLPHAHLEAICAMKLIVYGGDYVFVHAGVKPGVALDEQDAMTLLWIRAEFLSSPKACDYVVVHGHTPTPEPFNATWRIGVDTGAYATGVLTCVRLHAETRQFMHIT